MGRADRGHVIRIARARERPVPLELSHDPRFRRRVIRLAAVSSVALGMVWGLAVMTLDAPIVLAAALLAGWILMPTMLLASLSRPYLRYGLVVPSSLVTIGLVAAVVGWLPDGPMPAAGWVLMTGGVALGGALGLWLWYRVLPVPAALHDPFSVGRWVLVAVHVGMIVTGFALASTALWPG
jgi:hypothetical protein